MQTGLNEIRQILRADKRRDRKRVLLAVLLLLVLSTLYMCVMGWGYPVLSPLTVGKNILTFLQIKLSQLRGGALYLNQTAVTSELTYYAWTISRLKSLLLMWLSGAILALSGTVYQAAMRNPMAVPTMLGVSSGVSLAQMILVLMYADAVYSVKTFRYVLSYGISIGSLLLILLLAKLAGGKRSSVADMLIVGTVVNRVFRIVQNYIQSNMDYDTLYIYQDYAQNSQNYFQNFSDLGLLVLVAGVVLLPIYLMRFTYNAVCFEDEDTLSLGVRPALMRTYGLLAGGLLTATAMIHAGNIGMLATVVPLMCRYIYGANFKSLLGTSALWGGIILVLSNLARNYAYLGEYQIPLGNVVSLLSVPLLIWVLWTQKTSWTSAER